jgi:alkaline phosphatase D
MAPVVFPTLPPDVAQAIADMTGVAPKEGAPYNLDEWDGYTADRRELLTHLYDGGIRNTVFLSGDVHSSWANDLPLDAATYPRSPSVATELIAPSLTSGNLDEMTGAAPRTSSVGVETAFQARNRHVRMVEFDSHGFAVLDVTPGSIRVDWYYVSDPTDRNASVRRGSSFAVADGTQQVRRVT